MEEHLDDWIDHLDGNVVPELETLKEKVDHEWVKISKLTEHYAAINQKVRSFLDRKFTHIR